LESFDKWAGWALDFLGSINPPYNHNYDILVCTYYVTKWMESKALPTMTKQEVVGFIHEENLTIFEIPWEIVIDGGTQLTSRIIKYLMDRYNIKHRVKTRYHPQSNG
jgi:hypothetical protein